MLCRQHDSDPISVPFKRTIYHFGSILINMGIQLMGVDFIDTRTFEPSRNCQCLQYSTSGSRIWYRGVGGGQGEFSLILPREQSRVVIKVYKVETTANFTRMYTRLKSQSETRAFSINNFALKYKQKCDEDNAALMFISPKTS